MQSRSFTMWVPRLAAFAVGAAVASSVAFWVLRWPSGEPSGPAAMVAQTPPPESNTPIDANQWARLLGATVSAPTPAASTGTDRLRLLGVVAGGPGKSAALIAVDGQAPKAYRVGSNVVDGLWLVAVSRRHAVLGPDVHSTEGTTLEMLAVPQ